MRIKPVIIASVIAASLGFGIGQATAAHPPACPTEDSCSASYHNGSWHITPVRP